jgi:Dynamin GTPase effector domain
VYNPVLQYNLTANSKHRIVVIGAVLYTSTHIVIDDTCALSDVNATHTNSASNAEDMSAILEAYWLLAAKRFVDNVCMTLDKAVMGDVARHMQEECYRFVQDDARLARFFEEDSKLLARKKELTLRRDRLSKASAAMANIQVRVACVCVCSLYSLQWVVTVAEVLRLCSETAADCCCNSVPGRRRSALV